ncbi:MAG: Aromatic amino acid lyase, partial [Gaiellales bacterium]|nr:Aromatic amino acid lyase [Gaiellales bacterium]
MLLTGSGLTIEQVEQVALGSAGASLAPQAVSKIEASRALIDQAVEAGTPTYGVNTGFG